MMRIRLETDAFYLIFQNVKNKKYDMIALPVYLKEIEDLEDLENLENLRERSELMALLNKY